MAHERAAPVAEGGLGHLLQLDVDRQAQVVAGDRRRAREGAHRAARRVDLDLLHAGGTVQFALVRQFDADLADVVGALVVRGCLPARDAFDILVVDAADVAHDVRGHLAVRILPEQPRLDVHAGEAIAVHREARDLLVGEPRAQRQALEVLRFLEQLAEAAAVARLHVDDRREFVDRRVEVLDLRRHQLERVTGIALREHHAVAIGDDAAIGRDRHDGDAVRFGQRAVVAVLHHLQVDEAREQSAEREQRERAGHDQPAPEQEELALARCALRARRSRGRRSHGHAIRTGAGRPWAQRSDGERAGRCGHCSSTDKSGHRKAPTSGGTK